MKLYVMAFLKTGPNRHMDKAEAMQIQRADLSNIRRKAKNGNLVLAGPFMIDAEIRGLYLFNASTIMETRSLAETDPAIESGRLQIVLYPWYVSAALMNVNNIYSI